MSLSLGNVPAELWVALAVAIFTAVPSAIAFVSTMRKVAKNADRDLTKKDLEVGLEALEDILPAAIAVVRAARAKEVPKAKAIDDGVKAGLVDLRALRGHAGIGQTPVKVRARLQRLLTEAVE